MQDLLELSDSMVLGMLDHPTLSNLFPCFQDLRAARDHEKTVRATKKCMKCWRTAAKRKAEAIALATHCLASLPKDKKRALCQALQTKRIRVRLPRPGGKVILLTF